MATYNANVSVAFKGLEKLKQLEAALNRVVGLQKRLENALTLKVVSSQAERSIDRVAAAATRLSTSLQSTNRRGIRLDTRPAVAAINEIERQLRSLSSRAVQIRIVETRESRSRGGGIAPAGGGMSAGVMSAAMVGPLATALRQNAAVNRDLSRAVDRLETRSDKPAVSGRTPRSRSRDLAQPSRATNNPVLQGELQRALEAHRARLADAAAPAIPPRWAPGQYISGYQRNAFRFPNLGADPRASALGMEGAPQGATGLQFWATRLRNTRLGEKQFDLSAGRFSGSGGPAQFQKAFQDFFKTAEAGTYKFTGLTDRLNRIYQRMLESNRIPYKVDPVTRAMSVQSPLRSAIRTPSSDAGFFQMNGPLQPRTLTERYRAGSIGFFGPRGPGGGGGIPPVSPGAGGRPPTPPNLRLPSFGLGSAGTLLGAYAGISGLQKLGQSAIDRESANLGLKANTEQYKEYGAAVKAVQQQVKLLGLSQTEAAQGFTTAYAALRPLGIQLETINQLQQGFVASSRASGRSVEESTAAWRQLVQAIGKGRLNGDELVSISENAPRYYQELAKTMGVSVGALKDLGEEGKITSDILVRAGLNLRDSELGKLDKILQGPQQQIKNLGNAFQDLGVELGRVFGPALGQELKNVVEGIKGVTRWVKTLSPEMGKTAVEAAKLVVQLLLIGKALEGMVIAGRVAAYLSALAATSKTLTLTAGGATLAVNGLTAAMLRLAGIGIVTIGVKYVVDQVGGILGSSTAAGRSEAAGTAGALAAQYGGKSSAQLQQALQGAQANLTNDRKLMQRLRLQIQGQESAMTMPGEGPLPSDRSKLTELQARVKANEARVRYLQEQLKKPTAAGGRQAEIDRLLQGVPTPLPDGKDADKAAKEAEAAAEKLAAEQRQLQQQLAQNQIALDDQVFKNQQDLIRQRYELERELAGKARENWVLGFTGAGREQAQLINDLRGGLDGYADRITELKQKISEAEQKLKSAQAGVAVAQMGQTPITVGDGAAAVQGTSSGVYRQGGIGPRGANQYGPHFDIKRSDGSYFPRNSLDQYVSVNGRSLSSGVTVPGGEYGAPRSYGGHAGWDYAFGAGAGLTLKGGAKWTGSSRGSYGDSTAFMTPDGKVYKIIHGTFQPGATASSAASPAATAATAGTVVGMTGQDQVAAAQGDVTTATAELQGYKAQYDQLLASVTKLTAEDVAGFVLRSTDAFRQQGAELTKQTAALQLRTRLEMEGTAPELIEAEVQKLDIRQQLTEKEKVLQEALNKGLIKQEEYASALSGIQEAAAGAAGAIDQLAQAQIAANDPINKLMGQWNREINDVRGQYAQLAQTIEGELASGMSNAITGLVTGTQTVQQAFSQMFANIGKAFLDMATQMIAKALMMKVLGILGGGIGGGGGGFGGFSGAGPYQFPSMGSYSAGFTSDMSFFAEGGFVTGPTPAVVGEGGANEYIIPENKMGSAMAKWSAGARGDSVVNGADPTGAGGVAVADAPIQITTGPILRFENRDYVGREEFAAGLQSAAKQGEARALATLKNSPGARRRVRI